MKQTCKFCPNRDVGKVIPGLFPDIDDLINNHKITDNAAEVTYNGISDIADVGIRINDEFDAIMLSRALMAGVADANSHGSSQSSGSTAPVAGAVSNASASQSES